MKVHFVQHEPFEGPGTILEWALLTNCEGEIADGQLYIQSAAYIRSQKQYLPPMRTLLFQLLEAMEKSSTGEPEKNEY